jgi:L-ascorbate metabolism protein UlaG (beta-lactamase superfamily)
MLNITLRRKARQFGKLVKESALQARAGATQRPQLVDPGRLAITFIGHSSFFLQVGGKNVLIDPNFAQWLFILKRLRQPGLAIRDLPPIDYILITHAHFDHLHRPSLRAVARRTRRLRGSAPAIVVPSGVSDIVHNLGFRRIIDMKWWETFEDAGFTVTSVPANHWGARMLRDFHRGFGGYVVRSGRHSVYHAGDTAYFNGFHEIGNRLRPEVALLPIGAYHPESFRNVHTSPEDAVQAFLDLRSRLMIPMHYGTFRLSHEPMHEPEQRLLAAAKREGVDERVLVLREGASHVDG